MISNQNIELSYARRAIFRTSKSYLQTVYLEKINHKAIIYSFKAIIINKFHLTN